MFKCWLWLSFFRFLWEIFEEGRIKNLVSGLDKKSGQDGRHTKHAILKEGSETSKKTADLIASYIDMMGWCNKWAGMFDSQTR